MLQRNWKHAALQKPGFMCFNERLKQFKLIGRKIPLSLAPLATQMVVVAACLVNFQGVLCK